MSSEEEPVAWLRALVESDLSRDRAQEAALLPQVREGEVFRPLYEVQNRIARCEAELAILDEHARLPWFPAETLTAWRSAGVPEERIAKASEKASCARCHTLTDGAREDEDQCVSADYPCRTVRLLASGYKHRPGFPSAFAGGLSHAG